MTARVLIVEDDAAIRRLVRAALDRAGYVVIEAATAREGLALADIEKPDAILLDLGLPDRDGLELIPLFRARGSAPLLVVSARTDTAEKVAALDLGADDYLAKPFDTEELLARIRSAIRRGASGEAPEGAISLGEIDVDFTHRRVRRAGEDVHLTPKEYEVLIALAHQPDKVLTHAHLLRSIWGPAHETNVEYLRIVVRALRQKLEPDPSRPELIVNVPGVGYRLQARN